MPFDRKIKGKKTGRFYSDIPLRDELGRPTGKRHRKLLPHATSMKEARKAEDRLALRLSDPEAPPPALTFAEFTEEHFRPYARQNYENYTSVSAILTKLEAFFGPHPLREISVLSIERYKRHRAAQLTDRGTYPKNSSVNTEVKGVLSAVMAHACEGGHVSRNPCRGVSALPEEEPACPRLAPEEEAALLGASSVVVAYLAPLVTVALGTGMRKMEMLNLLWKDVDFARSLILVRRTKWKKDPRKTKGLPFGSRVRAALLSLPRPCDHVFATPKGKPVPGSTFQLDFKKACGLAGIEFRIHWLRHEFGSRLGDRDVSPYKIARLMGHSSIKMSMRYVHPKHEDLERAVEGLWDEKRPLSVTRPDAPERMTA